MDNKRFDVAVIGCGIAGSLAATAAARSGATVIAIDEAGFPGGALTAMGTGPMMTFHAGDKQVIRGLGQEVISRLQDKGLSPGHTVDSTGYTYTVTPFSSEGMKQILEEMMLEAGVHVLYHTVVFDAYVENETLQNITCISCGKKFCISAAVFIDATGDGDLFELAGVPYESGRPSDGKNQPMTTNFKIANVNSDKIRGIMQEHVEYFPFLCKKPGIERNASRLSVSGFNHIMIDGIQKGKVTVDRDTVLTFETDVPGEMIVNMSRINGEDPIDPASISRAETEGRRQVWELFHYLKDCIPGYENATLITSGPNVGIRSSRRMIGDYMLQGRDVLSNTMFEDRIALNGYPIDIHSADGEATDSTFLKEGTYYSIPYRCLTNPTVPNLMAAGRNISCSFEAQGSTRVSPCCAAIGHAAGCAAALASRDNIFPRAVVISELQKLLLSQNAYLG